MEKPITVAREEFANALIQLVNTTKVPAFVILDVMGGVTQELQMVAKKQYDNDLAAYEADQKERPTEETE